jgi:hypothetical protein
MCLNIYLGDFLIGQKPLFSGPAVYLSVNLNYQSRNELVIHEGTSCICAVCGS